MRASMRIARYFAALLGLATIGFAAGDLASHPNVPGTLGLLALIAAIAFLVSYLFRSQGGRDRAASEPEPPKARERARKPRAETVWAGWEAEEAQVAREQRRERRRR